MSDVLRLFQESKRFARSPLLNESALGTEVDDANPIAAWMEWLNISQLYHFNKVVQAAQEHFGAEETITWVANQQEYSMPGQSVRVRLLERTDTDPDRVILPINIGDRQRFDGIYGAKYNYIWSNVIGFSPTPAQSGTVNVLFIRRLPELMYGTATVTSTTIVFPATPDLGLLHNEDDYYNNAKVKVISATTGAGQTVTITDYVGSTRTATVAWPVTPTGTVVYNIECEIPAEYHPAVSMYTALLSKVVDEDTAANLKVLHEGWEALMVAGLNPRQTQAPRYVNYIDTD